MTCAACQANVTKSVKKLDGIRDVNVNLLSGSMTVEYDENIVKSSDIVSVVVAVGYGASADKDRNETTDGFKSEWDKRKQNAKEAEKNLKKRVIWSVVILIPLMYVSMGHMVGLPLPSFMSGEKNNLLAAITQLIFTVPVIVINSKFFVSGFMGIFKRSPNMDSLVALGSTASFVFSLFSLYAMAYNVVNGNFDVANIYYHHLYFESAAMILALVTVGKYLESRSKSKTSASLQKLIDLAPKTATIIKDDKEIIVSADSIVAGDIIVIRPGDVIPADGVIVEGKGFLDQAAVTGESLPVEKGIDDSVVCATKNVNGYFKFKAVKVGNDTTLSQIIRLVDEAGSSKAPIARIADRVSGIFVPIVIGIAVVTAIVWLALGQGVETALMHAVSVLVISCPCALGLATPVAIMVGTGKAANLGILIHSAESLETLHSVDTVVFDKTGTLTEGKPSVTDIELISNDLSREEFLKIAASLESGSTHPYALAILEENKKYNSDIYEITDFSNVSGRGVKGTVKDSEWIAGNQAFMSESGLGVSDSTVAVVDEFSAKGKTALLFAKDGKIAALVALSDEIRASAKGAIKMLSDLKVKTVMLTGDNKSVAKAVKSELNIDEVKAEVMPSDKEEYIRNLQQSGLCVAMIGDGINDAPALARADVGIAIGTGTDIAIETADIVLMKNSVFDAITAIKLSRSVIRNIKMNLFWAFFYNVIGIPVAAGALSFLGIHLSPMLASAAMSLSSLFVVTNALRLRNFKGVESTELKNTEEIKMTKVIKITGMACGHCTARVEKALIETEGVKSVIMSLEDGTATVETELDNAVLAKVVEDAGYTVTDCK